MKYLFILLVSILIIQKSVAPPVTPEKKEEKEHENEVEEDDLEDVVEYQRYLKEVVQALESDADFRAKLEKADEHHIRSGKIADELEHVNHHVRTKLDELKRAELERLRHAAVREYERTNGLNPSHMKIDSHLNPHNPHTFEVEDLKKLIEKTTKDLEEADKRRREKFKEYEMSKKFEQEEKMKSNMTEDDKKKFENEIHEMEKKHKEHEPLHHPGSKKQLEEVWEKQDHMENQEFDPRTFFFLHDLDGNGFWDQNELKTLFLKELDKLYADGHKEDDLVERAEEMERMREHVFNEADLNKDGLISYEEFLKQSQKSDFEQDPGWQTLDEQQIYSEQEYETYRRQKAKELGDAIAKQMSQEHHPAGQVYPGQQQFPSHPNQVPHQDYMQHPPQYQHQVPQQGQHPNQIPPQQGQYPNQMAHHQGQYPNQMPVQQDQFNQHAQQQFHPDINNINQQHPQYQQQNYPGHQQMPPQQQFEQVPQQQFHASGQQQQFNSQGQQQQFNPQGQQQQFNPQVQQQQQFNPPVQQQQFNPPVQQQQFNPPAQQQQQQQLNNPPVQQQQQLNNPPVQQQQQPVVSNNANQIPQENPSAGNAVHQNNQPPPSVNSQNQQNTQNQVPQQMHEQASNNNAQNVPNVVKE